MTTPRPRLFLHLGSHKTGTTALQTFSVANRETLQYHGLIYPDFAPISLGPKDGHHALAHAFSPKPQGLSRDQAEALIARWHQQASEQRATIVVSAEAIYRHLLGGGSFLEKRRRYLEVLKEALAGFDVVPVVVFRRPDDYIRSLYQEAVANLSKPRQLPVFADYVAKPPLGIDYTANARVVEEVFGTLKVLLYEELAASPRSLGEAFYAALGYSLVGHRPTARVRPSLTPEETVIKNAVNRHLTSRAESQTFIETLRTSGMQAEIRGAYPEPPYDLWPDLASRRAFLASRETDLAQLQQRYFPERETLFPPLAETTAASPLPALPEALEARAMACLPQRDVSR
jgi:hypothetical protein